MFFGADENVLLSCSFGEVMEGEIGLILGDDKLIMLFFF